MPTYDVFISYRRKDGSAIAHALAEYLRTKGLRVFYDKKEIRDSQDFKERIEASLRQAPNYLLIATTAAFEFYTDQEDWVKREMEIACENYDHNTGNNRLITVVVPRNAVFPRESELPENIRCLATPNRIMLRDDIPDDNEKLRILKAVTQVNRHNLWNAGHRWLEESREAGSRFAALNINASLFPQANKPEKRARKSHVFPIYVRQEDHESAKKPLMQALGEQADHMYLIGQGGIGKTTALIHIMNEAYGDGKSYTEHCQIPIYVALSTAPDTYGALYEGGKSTFIRRAIYKQIREDRTTKMVRKSEIAKLDEAFTIDPETAVKPVIDILSKQTAAPEYLLLLDGLNEVSRAHIDDADCSVIQMILHEINWLMEDCPNVRLVLTGRADEAMIHGSRLTRLELSGVGDESIRQYLTAGHCSQEKLGMVFENDALLETLRIPLFLVMYATLHENDEISTQGEILSMFFNQSKENLKLYTAQNRLSEVEEDVYNAASAVQKRRITAPMQCFMLDFLLPEIAWYMERRNLYALDQETIAEIIEPVLTGSEDTDICGRYGKQIFDKYCIGGSAKTHTRKTAKDILAKLGDDLEEITEAFIDCCMFSLGILITSDRKYCFFHQHIRDYFAAKKVINQLWLAAWLFESEQNDTAYESLALVLGDLPLSITMCGMIGESLAEHRNQPQFIHGGWRYMVPEELCERSLLSRCLHVLRGLKGSNTYILHNLLHILTEVRRDLSGENLSALDFSNCSLNGVQLSHPGLCASLSQAVVRRNTLLMDTHQGLMEDACILPGRNLLMTASHVDGTIKLWDIYTAQCTRTIEAHEQGVDFLYHDRKRSVVMTAGRDGMAFWNDATFEKIRSASLPGNGRIRLYFVAPGGEHIVYHCTDDDTGNHPQSTIYILAANTLECIDQISFSKGELRFTVLCEDKRYMVVEYYKERRGGPERYLYELYDRKTRTWTDLNSYKQMGQLSVCMNIGYLCIQNQSTLHVVDPVQKRTIMEVDAGHSRISRCYVLEDGATFAAIHHDKTQFFDIASGRMLASFRKNGFQPLNASISRQDALCVIHDGYEIYLYHYKHGKLLSRISSYWMRVLHAAVSTDHHRLLTTSGGNALHVWEMENNHAFRCSQSLPMHSRIQEAYWLNTPARCLLSCYDAVTKKHQLMHFDADTGQVFVGKTDFSPADVHYDAQSRSMFVERRIRKNGCKSIQIEQYDAESFAPLGAWTLSGDYILDSISPGGQYFLMSYERSRDAEKHIMRVFDTKCSCFVKELVSDNYVSQYQYSADGRYIAALYEVNDRTSGLYLYDGGTFELQSTICMPKDLSYIYDLRCDGTQVATARQDAVNILDLHTQKVIASLKHDDRWIPLVRYSPDGKMLMTATSSGTVRIWDLNTCECLQTIPHLPGVFIQGVDLRSIAPGTDLTEADKQNLRLYGALTD